MKKALLVYNPKSGNKTFKDKLDYVVEKFLERDIIINFYRINVTDTKIETILEKEKYEMIIFSGGDGTVNYGVSVLLKNDYDIPIGIIPAGTCNDFAKCIGVSTDVEKAVDTILNGTLQKVDVGKINKNNYFLSTFAGGLFAGVSFDTNEDLKKTLGPLAYYLKGISEVINLKPFTLHIETEKEVIDESAVMFIIVNGKNAAGFKELVKTANLTDGYMDIIIIKECYHVDLTKIFIKVLTADFLDDKNVRVLKAKSCKISNIPEKTSLTLDGEKWDQREVAIEVLNKKINVFSKLNLGE